MAREKLHITLSISFLLPEIIPFTQDNSDTNDHTRFTVCTFSMDLKNVAGRGGNPTETSKQSDNIFTWQGWASILAGMQLVALKLLRYQPSTDTSNTPARGKISVVEEPKQCQG